MDKNQQVAYFDYATSTFIKAHYHKPSFGGLSVVKKETGVLVLVPTASITIIITSK